ncbi:cytochrome c6, chloroplastic isoform X2 [Cicer arietinum]|uniref:Cytochrome c-553 n=1 Tax=Cicer arietinum TaxID=3827 RepID=A0A1S3EB16_CICAR|nr:cytochrome c6, chloroplastic isoform X2 [Cicer arietinum]
MKLGCLIYGYNNLLSSKNNNVKREEKQLKLIPSNTKQVKFFKSLAPPLAAAFLILSPICATPVSIGQTIDIQRGVTLFRQTCIGCHDAGGNIIQPGSTLYTKDLQRNGVDTEEEIYRVTYYGKGRMPEMKVKELRRLTCSAINFSLWLMFIRPLDFAYTIESYDQVVYFMLQETRIR